MYVCFVGLGCQPVGRQGHLRPVLVGSVEDMAQVAVAPLIHMQCKLQVYILSYTDLFESVVRPDVTAGCRNQPL